MKRLLKVALAHAKIAPKVVKRRVMVMMSVGVLLTSAVVLSVIDAQPATASCPTSPTGGTCSAVVDLGGFEYAFHGVPFNSVSTSDSVADTALSVQRHWFFSVYNHGSGNVGSASIDATSARTFNVTPPPPFTASTTAPLAANQVLRTSGAQEGAYSTDSAAPGFSSSRNFNTVIIPPGGGSQTLSVSFTVDSASDAYGSFAVQLDGSSVAGTIWTFTGSSDMVNTHVSGSPGSAIFASVDSPVVGTTYTLTFSGVIPNPSVQPITYKPSVQFQANHAGAVGQVFASSYSAYNSLLEGNVTYTLDDAYELHPSLDNNSSIVAYQGGTGTVAGTYPAVGAFVIGDKNASLGSIVNIWGSQWAKQNLLSGGVAPDSFKGFEGTSQPSVCGGAWTAAPGNSSSPPASIPGLMVVIVASHVSKTGSKLSGDVAHIVVVQMDPGYASDPGHAATGKVIAQIC